MIKKIKRININVGIKTKGEDKMRKVRFCLGIGDYWSGTGKLDEKRKRLTVENWFSVPFKRDRPPPNWTMVNPVNYLDLDGCIKDDETEQVLYCKEWGNATYACQSPCQGYKK